jgi:AraC-type transcriptional regulator N-terminus
MSEPSARIPVVYNASLCLVAQGAKEVMLEGETYRYAASEFLVVSVDLPAIGHVTVATPEKPYFALQLDIDPRQLSDLITEQVRMEGRGAPTERALFRQYKRSANRCSVEACEVAGHAAGYSLAGPDGHPRDLL